MKGFSIGVTTVYITEAIVPFWGEDNISAKKYTPMPVPKNKQTTDRCELQVEKALYLPPEEGILRMEAMIL
jgi:hypothetical protein